MKLLGLIRINPWDIKAPVVKIHIQEENFRKEQDKKTDRKRYTVYEDSEVVETGRVLAIKYRNIRHSITE